MSEHVDVLVIGAGISGIGAGYHLQSDCPWASYLILEGRGAIGGTWDLFRYPGIRSDSDMYTLGYRFAPWRAAKAIADGPSIRDYVVETAREHGIDRHIRFNHRVVAADWSSADALWHVTVSHGDETLVFTCGFLFLCSGYYDYAQGYAPAFPGAETFAGHIVHPQHWPEDLDYAGKRVVVIGSGATAVTLVPAMADKAAHVTMLQRSPSYVVARPGHDVVADWLRKHLPMRLAYGLVRWKNVLMGMLFFQQSRRRPAKIKALILKGVRAELGPDYDVDRHFTPRYNPWDQRMCLVPDADLFESIRQGRASVVTDHVERFTPTGIKLQGGDELPADIIVTATGLKVQLGGGMRIAVDGAPADLGKSLSYKGMMFSGVPNLASCFGYTNASWTLKVDLTCEYICRMLNHMRRQGYAEAVPHPKPGMADAPFMDFSSGYVQRAAGVLPRQGTEHPWKLYQNYALDLVTLRFGKVDDGVIQFRRAAVKAAA